MDIDRYLTGVLSDLFQPHVILPVQHFSPPRKLTPEHGLMMAVLDDAVQCVRKFRFATDVKGGRLFSEAKQWLLATDPHWPYSFVRICAVLDLDANAVRQHLRLKTEPVWRERRATRERRVVDSVTADTAPYAVHHVPLRREKTSHGNVST